MNKIKFITLLIALVIIVGGCSSKEKINSTTENKEDVVLSTSINSEYDQIKKTSTRDFFVSNENLNKLSFKTKDGKTGYLLHFNTDVEVNSKLKFMTPSINCVDENSKSYNAKVGLLAKNLTDYSTHAELPLDKVNGLNFEIILNQNIPKNLNCTYSLLYGDPRQVKGSIINIEFEK